MDDRRKQLRFRAWRRGFRELDLILGAFADRRLAAMSAAELNSFAALLEAPDQDVYAWIVGQASPPEAHKTELLAEIQAMSGDLGRG
jgi:antitoxin CptB